MTLTKPSWFGRRDFFHGFVTYAVLETIRGENHSAFRDVVDTVNRAIYTPVGRVDTRAADLAAKKDPKHPALQDFLHQE